MASTSAPIPAIPPPPGQTSNFVNSETLAKWNVLCVTMCLVFTTVPFLLRTYTRVVIKKEWILEDYMVLISWAGLVTYCALMTTTMHKHGGVHEWDLTLPEVHEAIYWFNVTSVEYAPIILCTKLSVLMLYRRVFLPNKWSIFDVTLRIFMAILILFYIATIFVKVFECTPREKIWNSTVHGKCIDISMLLQTSGLFNFITDLLILLVPVKAVWKLHMKKQRKMAIVLLFTVGAIAPVFSMVGFVVRTRISGSPDATYNQPLILLWAAAELSTGIICVCLPTLGPLAHRRQKGPTASILKGSDRTKSTRKKQFSLSGNQDLFEDEFMELRNGPTHSDTFEMPRTVETAGSEKEAKTYATQHTSFSTDSRELTASGNEHSEGSHGSNIMRTIEIEQSFA